MSEICPICKSSAILMSPSYAGYKEPQAFQIFNCPECKASFSFPMVDASSVYNNIYRLGRSVPEYNRYWVYMDEIKACKDPLAYLEKAEETYWGVIEAFRNLGVNKESAKGIEIGSGLGYLTYALKTDGYDIIGLDISTEAVKNAKENFGDHYVQGNIFEYAEVNKCRFDFAVLTEVIEHVENPLFFLEAIIKILKPKGKIILTTPNKSFFPKDAIWASTPPPVHRFWMGEESITWMANRLKTAVTFVDFSRLYVIERKIDVSSILNYATIGPILNENGELIPESQDHRRRRSFLVQLIKKIPLAKRARRILYKVMNRKNFRNCGKQCPVLCAILEKEEYDE
jgi:SAM-dependent methyltransferase